MILAIDAGNSRIKWGIFAQHDAPPTEPEFSGAILNEGFVDAPTVWHGCTRALLCNVAGDEMGQRISAAVNALGIPLVHFKASLQTCGLKNLYDQPEKLGVDRWAALVAAWQLYQQPCVVVSAGTAITIDAVNSDEQGGGVFLGGMILPGIRLMQQSLLDATAGVKESMGEWQDFPTNTANAVHTAAITAAAGNVKGMAARLQQRSRVVPLVIISGGDAQLLADCLLETIVMTNKVHIVDNLVLIGLLHMERDAQ